MGTFLGSRFTAVRERFFDNFTRANSSSLGTSTDGSLWTPTTSSLSISGNSATSPNSNTAYPMSTIDMPTIDNSVELTGTGQGSSAAIWVQSSTDWYLVGQDLVQTSYTYTGITGYSTSWSFWYTDYVTFVSGYTTYSYTVFTGSPNYQTYTAYASSPTYTTNQRDHYQSSTSANYGSITGYVNTQYLRLMKSVAGVISEVTNWALSTSSTIASFRVKTSGSNLTVQAYSDSALTNQLSTDKTYTVTGATTTSKYGISLKSSPLTQSYVIATSVNITRN